MRHTISFVLSILSYFLIGNTISHDANEVYTLMTLPAKSFKLRLYWHESYKWQDPPHPEQILCIDCSGSKCNEGDKIKVEKCKRVKDEFEFVQVRGQPGSLIRARNTDVCMRYFENKRGWIHMANCDSNDPAQRWVAMEGAFHEKKFDIRPETNDDNCMTQHHHPRPGEHVRASTHCDKAHAHETGFWQFY